MTPTHQSLVICDDESCHHQRGDQIVLDFGNGENVKVPVLCRKLTTSVARLGETIGRVVLLTDGAAYVVVVGEVVPGTYWVSATTEGDLPDVTVFRGSDEHAYGVWLQALRQFIPPGRTDPPEVEWEQLVTEYGETEMGEWTVLVEEEWLSRDKRLTLAATEARPTASIWSDVFTTVEPGVFAVRGEFWGLVDSPTVRDLASGESGGERLMVGGVSAFAFLDGGVVYSEQVDPDSWDEDVVDDGIWVVGTDVLQVLCGLLDLDPPHQPDPHGAAGSPELRVVDVTAGRTITGDAARQAGLLTTWSGIRELTQSKRWAREPR